MSDVYGSASVRIEPDASGFENALARALEPALRRVARMLQDIDTEVSDITRGLDGTGRAMDKVDATKLLKGLDKVDRKVIDLGKSVDKIDFGDVGLDEVVREADIAGERVEGSFEEAARGIDESLRNAGGAKSFEHLHTDAELTGERIERAFEEAAFSSDNSLDRIGGGDVFPEIAAQAEVTGERIEDSFQEAAIQSNASLSTIRTRMSSLLKTGALVATTVAGIGAAAFFKEGIQQASDLGESINAVNVTFLENADGVKALAREAATAVGLTENEFNAAAVSFASFAEQVGAESGDVVGVIDEITGRAADFASVMNIEVADAARIFRSGLAGETEPLKKYGIDLSAATVETYAYSEGIAESGAKLTENEKVLARYGVLMEATAKTSGDFANTSDSLANGLRILRAQALEATAVFGQALLPGLEGVVGGARGLVTSLEPSLAGLGDAVSESIAPAFEAIEPAITALVPSLTGIVGVIGLAFGALAPVIGPLADGLAGVIEFITNLVGTLLTGLGPTFEAIGTTIGEVVAALSGPVSGLLDTFAGVMSDLSPVISEAASLLGGVFVDYLVALIGPLAAVADVVLPALVAILQTAIPVLAEFAGDWWGVLADALNRITPLIVTLGETVLPPFLELLAGAGPLLAAVGDVILRVLGSALTAVMPLLEAIVSALAPVAEGLLQIGDSAGGVLLSVLDSLAVALEDVAVSLSEALVEAVEALVPVIPDLVDGFVAFSMALLAVVPLLVPLIPLLGDLVVIAVSLLVPIVDLAAAFLSLDGVPEILGAIGAGFLAWKAGAAIVASVVGLFSSGGALAGVIATIGGAIASVGSALGTVATTAALAFSTASGPIAGIGAAISAVLGPVGLVVAGVIAVGAALTALYFKVEPVRNVIDSIVDGLVAFGGFLLDVGQGALTIFVNHLQFLWDSLLVGWDLLQQVAGIFGALFTGNFSEAGERIGELASSIIDALQALPGRILAIFGDLPQILWSAIVAAFDFVIANLPGLLASLGGLLASIPGRIVSVLGSLGGVILDALGSALSFLVSEGPGLVLDALGFFADVHLWVYDQLVSLGATLLGWAADGFTALLGALPGLFSGVLNFFGGLGGRILDALRGLGGFLGDAFVAGFDFLVQDLPGLVEGLADWFVNLPEMIIGWIGDLAGVVGGWIGDNIGRIPGLLGTAAAGLVGFFASLPVRFGQALTGLGGVLLRALRTGIERVTNGLPRLLSTIGDAFSSLWERLPDLLTAGGGFIARLPGIIAGGIASALTGIGSVLWDGLVAAFNFVVDRGPELLSALLRIFTAFPAAIGEKLVEVGGAILSGLASAIGWVVSRLPGFIGEIIGFFVSIPGRILRAYGAYAGWLWDSIISPAFEWVVDNLPGAISRIAGFLVDLPGYILSAFTTGAAWLWDEIIYPAGEWVISNLPSLLATIGGFIASLPGRILSIFGAGASWLWDEVIFPAGKFVLDNLPSIVGSIVTFIGSLPGRIISAIGSGASWLWDRVISPAFDFIVRNGPKALDKIIGFISELPGLILSGIGAGASWLWDSVILPAFEWVTSNLPSALGAVVDFFLDLPGLLLTGFGGAASWLWDQVVYPAFTWVIDSLPDAIGLLVDGIVALPGLIIEGLGAANLWLYEQIFAPAFEWVVTNLPGLLASLGSWFASLPGMLLGFLGDGAGWIWNNLFLPAFNFLTEQIPIAFEGIVGFFMGLPGQILGAIGDLGSWLWERLQVGFAFFTAQIGAFFSSLPERAGAAVDAIVSFFTGLPGRITSLISTLGSVFADIGRSILNGIIDGIGSAAGFVADIGRSFAGFIDDKVIGGLNDAIPNSLGPINLPDNPIPTLKSLGLYARGDIVNSPTLGIFGEAGPEVILPLSDTERMVELLVQALRLSGRDDAIMSAFTRVGGLPEGLPTFANGAIFAPGQQRRISSVKDLEPPAALTSAFRSVVSSAVFGSGPDTDRIFLDVEHPGSVKGADEATHISLAEGLLRAGFTGKLFEDFSGNFTKGDLSITLGDREPMGGPGRIFSSPAWEDKLIFRMEEMARRFETLAGVSAGVDEGRQAAINRNGIALDPQTRPDETRHIIGRLVAAGLDIDYRPDNGGQWFAGDIPISLPNVGFEDEAFVLRAQDVGLQDAISDLLSRGGFHVEPEDFATMFNKLTPDLQDRVLISPFTMADDTTAYRSILDRVSKFAYGDVVNRPTLGVFGEAGPEVILPLSNRERMIELLQQALQMTGGVPAFAEGAIFKPKNRGDKGREISGFDDVSLPGPLRTLFDFFYEIREALNAVRVYPGLTVGLSSAPRAFGATDDGAHVRMISALFSQGFTGIERGADIDSGTMSNGPIEIKLSREGVEPYSVFTPLPEDQIYGRGVGGVLNNVLRFFRFNDPDSEENSALDPRGGFQFTIENAKPSFERLLAAGLDITFDRAKRGWVIPGDPPTPVSVEGLESENIPFYLFSEDEDVRAQLDAALRAGPGWQVSTEEDFAKAFNFIPGWLQDIVMVSQAMNLANANDADEGGEFGAFQPERVRAMMNRVSKFAYGDVVSTPTLGVFGEAGPEVILPLSKPERMVELLTQALSMTGDLPQYAAGAIFNPGVIGSGETRRPNLAISSMLDLLPPDAFRRLPAWLAQAANADRALDLSKVRLTAVNDDGEGGGSIAGVDQEVHLHLINGLRRSGWSGSVVENLTSDERKFFEALGQEIPTGDDAPAVGSGVFRRGGDVLNLGKPTGESAPPVFFEADPGPVWLSRLQDMLNVFSKAAADALPPIFENGPLPTQRGHLFNLDEHFDRIDILRRNGLTVDFDRDKGQWFVEGSPVSQEGLKDSSIPFYMKAADAGVQKRIEEIWAGRTEPLGTEPAAFTDAFNRLTGALQEVVAVAPFVPPEIRYGEDAPNPEGLLKSVSKFAYGDVVSRPTLGMFGEDGGEVIYPLTKGPRMLDISAKALQLAGYTPTDLVNHVRPFATGAVVTSGPSGAAPVGSVESAPEAPFVLQMTNHITTTDPVAAADEIAERFESKIFRSRLPRRADF